MPVLINKPQSPPQRGVRLFLKKSIGETVAFVDKISPETATCMMSLFKTMGSMCEIWTKYCNGLGMNVCLASSKTVDLIFSTGSTLTRIQCFDDNGQITRAFRRVDGPDAATRSGLEKMGLTSNYLFVFEEDDPRRFPSLLEVVRVADGPVANTMDKSEVLDVDLPMPMAPGGPGGPNILEFIEAKKAKRRRHKRR